MANSCVLRATGDKFNPADFLRDSFFEPCNIFLKGLRRSNSGSWNTSGITLEVSIKNEFSQQITDAVTFLKAHRKELLRLRNFTGIEKMSLDFGVIEKDIFVQSYSFPPELVLLSGELRVTLEVSIYKAG